MNLKEKMELRKKTLENKEITRLFLLYTTRYNKDDLVGANKIAWVLSCKFGIEGDKSYRMGSIDF